MASGKAVCHGGAGADRRRWLAEGLRLGAALQRPWVAPGPGWVDRCRVSWSGAELERSGNALLWDVLSRMARSLLSMVRLRWRLKDLRSRICSPPSFGGVKRHRMRVTRGNSAWPKGLSGPRLRRPRAPGCRYRHPHRSLPFSNRAGFPPGPGSRRA